MYSPKIGAEICAVFTAFRPDEYFLERVERVSAQVGFGIIVVDGGGELNDPVQLKVCIPKQFQAFSTPVT